MAQFNFAASRLKETTMNTYKVKWPASLAVALIALVACGGGGGNPGICQGSALVCQPNSGGSQTAASTASQTGSGNSTSTQSNGSSESLANICTRTGEQQFARSYVNETYLWYREIPNASPSLFSTVQDYFYALLTPALDSSGARKDRFSFIASVADADSLATGANVGYGADWVRDSAGRLRVTQVAPGSPAAIAGLERGGEAVSLISGSGNLYPNAPGASITLRYRATPASPERAVTLNAAPLVDDPVPQSQVFTTPNGQRVGYVLFNAHTLGARKTNSLTHCAAWRRQV